MTYPTKIATCCFCGSKAALTLDQGRHELSCAQCGAPLHDLKQIPVPKLEKTGQASPLLRRFPDARPASKSKHKKRTPQKYKKQKPWLTRLGKELFDVVEDLID